MIVTIDNTVVGVSPDGIDSVTQDVIIPHQAIMSPSPLEIYFDADPGTTLIWPADIIIPVHVNMRLSTTTTCWVYGERS